MSDSNQPACEHEHAEGERSRRNFMGAAVVAGTACLPAFSLAQGTPAATGPAVWLDHDQASLDRAYDQVNWAPNIKIVLDRYVTNSQVTRAHIGNPRQVRYGASEVENLDLFQAKGTNAPIHIFIHGGAWRGGEAREYSFLAEASLARGAHVLVPDFVNVLQSGGDLTPMAQQVAGSIAWAYKNAASFGGDKAKIFVSGHSSGAHLAAVALTTNWERDFGVPADVIKGAVLCSGLYDLKPARLSSRSTYVKFTDAVEDQLSPQRHLDAIKAPMVVLHGTNESPEFIRQSRDFADAAAKRGKNVKLLVGAGYNHFELLETLASPFGLAGRAALAQMAS